MSLDDARTEAVRARGFARASVTEMEKFLALFDAEAAPYLDDGALTEADYAAGAEWLAGQMGLAPEQRDADMTKVLLLAARHAHRIQSATGSPPPPPPPTAPAPEVALSTRMDTAAGVIYATPTYTPGAGTTLTFVALSLYTGGGALMEEIANPQSGVESAFAAQPGGTYEVRASCTQSDGQTSPEVRQGVLLPAPGNPSLVAYSDPVVELIVGPQVLAGDALVDGTSATTDRSPWPNWDKLRTEKGIYAHDQQLGWGDPVPQCSGTVSVDFAARTITGTGTAFTTELTLTTGTAGQYTLLVEWPVNSTIYQFTVSIVSDTELSIVSAHGGWTYGWLGDTRGGLRAWRPVASTNSFMDGNYYDMGLAFYALYHATGDPAWQTRARDIVDQWWRGPCFLEGANRGGDNDFGMSPRSCSLDGLLLRAREEGPTSTKWIWAHWWVTYQYNEWVWKNHLLDLEGLYAMRDTAYMAIFMAHLLYALPDGLTFTDPLTGNPQTSAEWKALWLARHLEVMVGKRVNGTVDESTSYIRRLQLNSGPSVAPRKRSSINQAMWLIYDGDRMNFGLYNEPWHTGLLLHAYVDLDRYLDTVGGYDPERAVAQDVTLRATRATYEIAYRPTSERPIYKTAGDQTTAPVLDVSNTRWRELIYGLVNDITPGPQGTMFGTATAAHNSTGWVGDAQTQWLHEANYIDLPVMPYRVLSGGLALTLGSAVATAPVGATTAYLTEIQPGDTLAVMRKDGYWLPVSVLTVDSDRQITLAAAWGAADAPNTRARVQRPNVWGTLGVTLGSPIVTGTGLNLQFAPGDQAYIQQMDGAIPMWRRYDISAVAADGTSMTLDRGYEGATHPARRYSDTHGAYFLVRSVTDDQHLTVHAPWPYANEAGLLLDLHAQSAWTLAADQIFVSDERQPNTLVPHEFGYCYHLTGDPTWLTWGDEIMASTYGDGVGPGADQWYAENIVVGGRSYNQGFRSSYRYLGYRAGA